MIKYGINAEGILFYSKADRALSTKKHSIFSIFFIETEIDFRRGWRHYPLLLAIPPKFKRDSGSEVYTASPSPR